MMTRLLFSLAALCAATASAAAQSSKINPDIADLVANNGTARVIVYFEQPERGGSAAAFSSPARYLSSALGLTDADRLGSLGAAVVSADAGDIEKLSENDFVKAVFPDIPEGIVLPSVSSTQTPVPSTGGISFPAASATPGLVAILDTGVEANHDAFKNNVYEGACYSTNHSDPVSGEVISETLCPSGSETEYGTAAGGDCSSSISGCGHGTHVGGTAVGDAHTDSNGVAVSGIFPAAGVLSIQVFSKFSRSADCGFSPAPCALSFPSDQLRALDYVANFTKHPILSVNMSLGGGAHSDHCDALSILTPALDQLAARGIMTAIASGNNALTYQTGSPGCVKSAVTVAATRTDTTPEQIDTNYSNISQTIVDIAAVGTNVYNASLGNSHATLTGTSMAAPFVSGVLGGMRTANSGLQASDYQKIIAAKATPRVDNPYSPGESFPLLTYANAQSLVDAAAALAVAPSSPAEIDPKIRALLEGGNFREILLQSQGSENPTSFSSFIQNNLLKSDVFDGKIGELEELPNNTILIPFNNGLTPQEVIEFRMRLLDGGFGDAKIIANDPQSSGGRLELN